MRIYLRCLCLMFFLFTFMVSSKAQTNMYVRYLNGTTETYAIDDIKSLTFTTVNLIVNEFAGGVDVHPLASLRHVNFSPFTSIKPVGDNTLSSLTELYPNPVNDRLNLRFSGENTWENIQIFDMFGREVMTPIATIDVNTTQADIDVSHLARGLYLCRLSGTHTEVSIKFIKN